MEKKSDLMDKENRIANPVGEMAGRRPDRIVFPGEEISQKPERISYAFIENGKTYSTVVGLFSEGKLVPLEGPYEPLLEDIVVGIITEVRFSGYSVDINCPYISFLSSREIRERFEMGDAIMARIVKVDEVKNIDLGDAKKLPDGHLVKVSSVKVPRIIGKKNSMIETIQAATGCQLSAGRNGYIWVAGKGDFSLAQKAIRMIESQAHTRGLTDRVAAFLKSQKE
jgi:exosome complex component RRP4